MDNITVRKIATSCATTWHVFRGVWSANNFPKCKIRNQKTFVRRNFKKTLDLWHLCRLMKFQIINSSPSNKCGEHWLLLCAVDVGKRIGIFVWDCLGRPLSYYGQFDSRLLKLYGALEEVEVINLPLQKLRSNLCGLYCLYLVHYQAKKPFNIYTLDQNHLLMQTTEIDVVRFFNEEVKILAFGYKIC